MTMKNRPDDKTFFLGKVTASVTHEVQNVLAIIRETSGLMEDILMMERHNYPELCERLWKSVNSIKSQIRRGVEMTSNLNMFAHTTYDALCPVDLHALTEKLLILTERIFRNKGFEIVLTPSETPPVIVTDPVLFQTLFFLCLEALENTLPHGSLLVIQIAGSGDNGHISITCPDIEKGAGPNIEEWKHWGNILKAADELSARITLLENPIGIFIMM
jgi:C4-dicarboxylate-specific signal transduction histidine kinase